MFNRTHEIDVKAVDENGATALHTACISLLIQNVQALLKLGANPNAQDAEGNTSLHLCILQMIQIKSNLNENQTGDEEVEE